MLNRDAYADAPGEETVPARCPECGFVFWEVYDCPTCKVPLVDVGEDD